MRNFLIVSLIIIAITALFIFLKSNQSNMQAPVTQTITTEPTANPVSCQVCGSQGIHNVKGNTCPEGYACKEGQTTTASYCVKPDENVNICESPSEENF